MTKRIAEKSGLEKGGAERPPAISQTDISRTVGELATHQNLKIQVQFRVAADQARSVSVAGTFNGWNPGKTPLEKIGEGWKATIALPRGRYEYRFVVDGKWVTDPSAAEAVPNPFGSSNSVLNV